MLETLVFGTFGSWARFASWVQDCCRRVYRRLADRVTKVV